MRFSIVPAALSLAVADAFPQFPARSSESFLATDSAFYEAVVAPLYERVRPLLSQADQKRYTDLMQGTFESYLYTRATNSTNSVRPYTPAGPGDLRSPCPLLNTLANHDYIPHDGRNLSMFTVSNAISTSLNASPLFGIVPSLLFIAKWGKTTFSLEDLQQYGYIRHNASLALLNVVDVREPKPKVQPQMLQAMFDDNLGQDYVDLKSLAKTRIRVERTAPKLPLTLQAAAVLEASFVPFFFSNSTPPSVATMPAPDTYRGNKQIIRTIFRENRFPLDEGWKPFGRSVQFVDFIPAIVGLEMYKNTLKPGALLQDFVPIGGSNTGTIVGALLQGDIGGLIKSII